MTGVKDQEVIKSMKRIIELFSAAFMGAVASKLLELYWIIPFPFQIMAGVLVAMVVLLFAIVFILLEVMMSRLMKRLIRIKERQLGL